MRLIKLCCAWLEKREYRLPFAVLGAPETFVERGVGRACCRTGAFLNFYTMKVIGVMSVVLAQAATHVRTIHVTSPKLEIMHQNYLSIERAYQNGAFEDFETFAESFLDSTTGAESTAARQIRDILGGPPGPENAGAHELREMLGSTPEQWQA